MAQGYQAMAAQYARKYGLPVNIFLRQIRQESGFNPNARSPAGAQGIAQFMPATARGMGVNPWNPRSALEGAARMDAANLRKYGNWRDVLSLYNSGRGWATGRQIGETRNYVQSILGGQGGGAGAGSALPPSPPSASPVDLSGPRQQYIQALIANLNRPRGQRFGANLLPAIQQFAAARQQAQQGLASSAGSFAGSLPTTQAATGGMGEMEQAIRQAQRMGLHVGENGLVGKVNPVHVKGSYHYQTYGNSKVGRASDISGSPQQMAAFYRWAQRTYGRNLTELFYDPLGAIKNGRGIPAIGGHGDHVHIAF